MKQQINKILSICLFLMFCVSCKTLKIDANTKLTKKANAKEVLAIHKAKEFNYKTLQSRVKVNYNDGKKEVSPSVSLRMEKDEKIWISAKFLGFTVAKIYITPYRVSFYEKLGKRYYDGNFETLSTILGQELNFEKVQNLFLGQSILALKAKDVQTTWQPPNIMSVKPQKKIANFDLELLFYLLNAKVFKYEINKQGEYLNVGYLKYQKIENQDFPETMKIEIKKAKTNRTIGMIFKGVELDKKISFPYTIPEGYTKFEIRK